MTTSHNVAIQPIGAALKEAWIFYKKNMNVLALVSIIPLVFGAVSMVFEPELAAGHSVLLGTLAVMAVFNILNLVFSIFMPVALIATIDEIHHGRTLSMNDAYKKAFSLGIPYLFVLLLTGIIVLGGSILLIIPGIVVNIYLAFVVFAFLIEGKRGIDALIQSAWYVRGLWFDILARKISVAIVIILGLMVFSVIAGVASVASGFGQPIFDFLMQLFLFMAVVPFMMSFSYVVYKDIKNAKAHTTPTPAFIAEAEKILIILLLIAALTALTCFFFWSFGPHHFIDQVIVNMQSGGTMHGGGRAMMQYNSYKHGFMGY
ncbi:MAG: hypothetical protein WCQ60_03725 [bacterium]